MPFEEERLYAQGKMSQLPKKRGENKPGETKKKKKGESRKESKE